MRDAGSLNRFVLGDHVVWLGRQWSIQLSWSGGYFRVRTYSLRKPLLNQIRNISMRENFGLCGCSEFSERSLSLRVSDQLCFELSEVYTAFLSRCGNGGAWSLSYAVREDCDFPSMSTCLRNLIWTRVAASFSRPSTSRNHPIFVCCSSSCFSRLESVWRSYSLVVGVRAQP